jgi:CheY-like chemotaxis protein
VGAKEITDSGLHFLEIFTAWPVILFVLIILFRRQINSFVANSLPHLVTRLTKASVGPTSFEFENEAAVQAFTDTVQSGIEERKDQPQEALKFTLEQVSKLSEAVQPRTAASPLTGRSILWVDDRPSGNVYESNLLKELGARVVSALSTNEALERLERASFDLIISDVHRIEDGEEKPTAGYDLLERLKRRLPKIPVVFYTTGASKKRTVPQVVDYGARVEDRPRDLVNTCVEELS